jgi:hypothetical protein
MNFAPFPAAAHQIGIVCSDYAIHLSEQSKISVDIQRSIVVRMVTLDHVA